MLMGGEGLKLDEEPGGQGQDPGGMQLCINCAIGYTMLHAMVAVTIPAPSPFSLCPSPSFGIGPCLPPPAPSAPVTWQAKLSSTKANSPP